MNLTSRGVRLSWPSHVKDTLLSFDRMSRQVDLVINVVDSRSPRDINLHSLLKRKFPRSVLLNLYSKSDLSGMSGGHAFNLRLPSSRGKILRLIRSSLSPRVDGLRAKGYLLPHLRILVVGFPNSGKSTLINLLKGRRVAPNHNFPGVTRKITRFSLGGNLWLYDTPGVFFRNSSSRNLDRLFLLNALPVNIADYSEILRRNFQFINDRYGAALENLVGARIDDYSSLLGHLAARFNYKSRNNEPDLARAEAKLLSLLRGGGLGNISWDS